MVSPGLLVTAAAFLRAVAVAVTNPDHTRLGLIATFGVTWLLGAVAWAVFAMFVYPHFLSPLRHLPQPEGGHWLLGQGRKMMRDNLGEPAREWVSTINHEGLIRYLWFFNRERVIVCSPKGLAEVLVTKTYQFKRPELAGRILSPVLGRGILLTEGDVHKMQRRNLMPAFAFRHIKDLYPIFWQKSREVVAAMSDTADAQGVAELDALSWASRCTLDIIGEAGMGCDFGAIRDPNNHLNQIYKSLMQEPKQARILNLLFIVLPTAVVRWLPMERNRVLDRASQQLRSVCRGLIRDKKARLANKNLTDVDILSVALESGHFSDDNLVDQLLTFLAAGHETTASSLTWAVYLLCCHPDIQTRLRDEVRASLPPLDNDGAAVNVTSSDIDKLPYLQAVCSEVLRLFSPVPQTSREAAEDTTVCGQRIPKGTVVMLCPWAINADRRLWGDDALEFRPERWLAGEADGSNGAKATTSGGASSNYAFMTFLHGPRSCIGASFARSEFACLLAAWVGRFEFELVNKELLDRSKLVVRPGVTARPKGGMWVKAKSVPGW